MNRTRNKVWNEKNAFMAFFLSSFALAFAAVLAVFYYVFTHSPSNTGFACISGYVHNPVTMIQVIDKDGRGIPCNER